MVKTLNMIVSIIYDDQAMCMHCRDGRVVRVSPESVLGIMNGT